MNKIEKAIDEIRGKLSSNDDIFAVILYGSASRGDYSLRHSDIDILIIMESMNKKPVLDELNNICLKHRVKIHPEFQSKKTTYKDHTLLWKMFQEGRVLFCRGIWFLDKKNLGLEAFRLYRFDTSAINKVDRVMFSRSLHGRKGQKGFIDGISVTDAGKGALVVDKNKWDDVEKIFTRFKIKFKVLKTLYG